MVNVLLLVPSVTVVHDDSDVSLFKGVKDSNYHCIVLHCTKDLDVKERYFV